MGLLDRILALPRPNAYTRPNDQHLGDSGGHIHAVVVHIGGHMPKECFLVGDNHDGKNRFVGTIGKGVR